jgi:glucarate dehydratase
LEFYSLVAENYAPFYSTPIECTNRDAGFVLDGLLDNESELQLEKNYTDTHYIRLPEGTDVIEGPNLKIVEGQMAVPKGEGLGVTLDRGKLARAHETYQKCGMKERDDAFTMRKFEPGWQRSLF